MLALSVNLVVACTDRKTLRPAARLRLRAYRQLDPADRVSAWVTALRTSDEPAVRAMDLYVGDHWLIAKGLATEPPPGVFARLWVCSAGYGLINTEREIHAYSATFTAGHADSVATGRGGQSAAVTRAWWSRLAREWRRTGRNGGPHSLGDLAEAYPGTPMFVVGSPRYIDALADDLLAAAECLRSEDLLSVFSTGAERLRAVERYLVPYNGRLQSPDLFRKRSHLGGAYPSLNIRAAGEALTTAARTRLRRSELQAHFGELMTSQPPHRRYDRARATPVEVEAFIRAELARDPRATHTRLLREFRDRGHAFEYTRFRGIFQQVKASLLGGGGNPSTPTIDVAKRPEER